MSTVTDLQSQIHTALRGGEKLRLDVLRMLLSAVKQKQIDSGEEVDKATFLSIVQKLIKQRRESSSQYTSAGRAELAAREENEIEILQALLPAAPDAADIAAAIAAALAESGATSLRDMGKVMAQLKNELPAADMSEVSKLVKEKLSAG